MINSKEFRQINAVLSPVRAKGQVNGFFEADCEIIKTKTGYWGCSTDTIAEEIASGLYRLPQTWGWISAMASVSDLTAAGLKPSGLVISCQWTPETSGREQKLFFSSVKAALHNVSVPFLGGDTNSSSVNSFTSTIFGESTRKPITRMGVRPNDYLILLKTHALGVGPMLGITAMADVNLARSLELRYRPTPNWKITNRLSPWISASIDSSDGIAIAVGLLAELNQVGFKINFTSQWFPTFVRKTVEHMKLTTVAPLLGDHGDFHTLISVRPKNFERFSKQNLDFLVLGRATTKPQGVRFAQGPELRYQDINNCPRDADSLKKLISELSSFYKKSGL